ncbi:MULTISPECIES: hypothetical protein [Klebsiella]|uniref:hypothetical protein n=1 Tax=Klebsiella TaxID=570 RepID=UPI000F5106DF|nr:MULTISPECIES: hypothetical protein [Klebsiella]
MKAPEQQKTATGQTPQGLQAGLSAFAKVRILARKRAFLVAKSRKTRHGKAYSRICCAGQAFYEGHSSRTMRPQAAPAKGLQEITGQKPTING